MSPFLIVLGVLMLLFTLSDVFETIVLPRTVQRGIRLTPLLLRGTWIALRPMIKALPVSSIRQTILVAFAPMSIILLLILWATLLIFGFAMIHAGYGTPWDTPVPVGFGGHLYATAVDFLTLGLGDMVTSDGFGRFLCVLEAANGFGFLGLVIGFVPVFYSAFSRREAQMVLLDSKAGSLPTAAELMRRHADGNAYAELVGVLKDFEAWSAQLLEGYLSYPFLAFYRSQHDEQSWLITLTAILDACALIETGFENAGDWYPALRFQSRATFAMARHVIVDLAYVLNVAPDRRTDRLPDEVWESMRHELSRSGLDLASNPRRLKEIRASYEPYVSAMAQYLLIELPPWHTGIHGPDNWQTSAWDGMRHF